MAEQTGEHASVLYMGQGIWCPSLLLSLITAHVSAEQLENVLLLI